MSPEQIAHALRTDPIRFGKWLWPHVSFYDKQIQAIESLQTNDETMVPAGNMLGKDFMAGFLVVHFFLTRHPCRVVTTSAKDDHLRVLWGEIGRFIQSSRLPLDARQGGPLLLRHHDIRKYVKGQLCPLSYVTGLVASPDSIAAMQGHHIAKTGDGIPRTLFVSDESSSVRDEYYKMASTWANRKLIIGNPWPCENFFKKGVKEGDLASHIPGRFYRKVIRIRAEDSPNVRYALAEIRAGRKPSGRMLLPGVKDYDEYVKNRATWDKIQQCVSLDGEFYEGAELLLFPPEWLNLAERRHVLLRGQPRKARAIGCDPGEGGASSCWSVVDEYGLIKLVSMKTPDTNVIPNTSIALMNEFDVPPERFGFDRGGGGKQHADRLRDMGYSVRTVAFGETMVLDPTRRLRMVEEKKENREKRYAYVNRRAQMYGELSLAMDPDLEGAPRFALPPEYAELRRQLAPLPKLYDPEGRMKMLPKNPRSPDSDEMTLNKLLGCSPDEADSLVVAYHVMTHEDTVIVAGAI